MEKQNQLADIGGYMTKIQIDTRQKAHKHEHVDSWFDAHGVEYFYKKLDFGDYAAIGNGSNVICDTKKDMQELAGNIGRDHARFVRELDRARDAGYRLYVLVEELEAYNDRSKIPLWVSRVCRQCRKCDPRKDRCRIRRFKPMNGPQMAKIIERLELDHGCRFLWCKRGQTARVICDLLGVDYDR